MSARISRYCTVELARAGSAQVESLTSYVCGVARANRLSRCQLLKTLFADDAAGCLVDSRLFRNGNAHTFNSCGRTQKRLLRELARATSRKDLAQTCLSSLERAVDLTGAIARARRWCGPCFLDSRRKGERVSDMLAWHFADLEICPLHRVALADRCPRCKAPQSWLPLSGALDVCVRCGSWLGFELALEQLDAHPQLAYQKWLLGSIEELLLARDQLSSSVTGTECARFLQAIRAPGDLLHKDFARRLRLSKSTLLRWLRNEKRPALAQWMRLCAGLNISPTLTLIDPDLAGAQQSLDLRPAGIGTPVAPQRARRIGMTASVQARVRRHLDTASPSVGSVQQLAESLGVSHSQLYHYARTDVLQLAARWRRDKKRQSHTQRGLRAATMVVRGLMRQGTPFTVTSIAREVAAQIGCSTGYAMRLVRRVIRSELDRAARVVDEAGRQRGASCIGRPKTERLP